jgi:MinD superfamily P-loop ATPase
MRVTIASGKGGTGKTFLSANLACILSRHAATQYIDCDVEEPDGRLFLNPDIVQSSPVFVDVPEVNPLKCNHCGKCAEICQYHAIASLPNQTLVFPELCHSCGGCVWVCPTCALSWKKREVGVVSIGSRANLGFVEGRLRVGESQSPPVIHSVLEHADSQRIIITDAPPGASCPAIASVKGSDFVLFVAEPTPFGLHDLELVVEMARALKVPFAVVVNREGMGDARVEEYCRNENIPLWEKIPYDRNTAQIGSSGGLVVEEVSEMVPYFERIAQRILKELKI